MGARLKHRLPGESPRCFTRKGSLPGCDHRLRLCLLKSPFLLQQLMMRPTVDTLWAMMSMLVAFFLALRTSARSRAALQLEVLALRHQLQVLHRTRPRRLRLTRADRWLWMGLSGVWTGWRTALVIVKPETVIGWHRRGFRAFWTWRSRRRLGRPAVPLEIRALIRSMSEIGRASCRERV